MIASPTTAGNLQSLRELVTQLHAFVHHAAQQGTPVHEVERGLWQQRLALGHTLLGQFFDCLGTGDQGPTVTLPTGQTCQRLEHLHQRRYVSIFGSFQLQRTVYGSREGQKIDFVPLDHRLQLPASPFSYLLQDWDQALCVEQAFDTARSTVARMLGLPQSVDSLEGMNAQMAAHVSLRPGLEGEGGLLATSQPAVEVCQRGNGGMALGFHHFRGKGLGRSFTQRRDRVGGRAAATCGDEEKHRQQPKGSPFHGAPLVLASGATGAVWLVM